ncbi:MAG: hypothetical protein IJW40_04050 [Clostridia bacterium]|nr:hypothetical protein [Clostridia bacterium]
MKNEKVKTKVNRKKQLKVWLIRIFAILLVAFMLVGSCYYTLLALFS